MAEGIRLKAHLDCLDQLRGVAIVAVFWYHVLGSTYGAHYLDWAGPFRDFAHPPGDWTYFLFYPLSFGALGVPLFFVISGFCIHLSHRSGADTWGGFYNRRFWRIYPPYFVALLLCAAGTLFLADRAHNVWRDGVNLGLFHTGMHILLIHNFSPLTLFSICPAFWSIAVEVQLYLLYFFLFYLIGGLSWRRTLILLAVVELGCRSVPSFFPSALTSDWYGFLLWSPACFWFSWALGAWIADRYREGALLLVPLWTPWTFALLAMAATFFFATDNFYFTLCSVASFYVLRRFIALELNGIKWQGPFARYMSAVGKCSYSFYLFHQPAVRFYCVGLYKICPHRWVIVLGAIFLWAAVHLLSHMAYLYVEKPSIRFGHRFLGANYAARFVS